MRLPKRIAPCPIVEAVFHVRFTSGDAWGVMPGLLYAFIRERFREQEALPLAQLPEEVRGKEPKFQYQPLARFRAENMALQLGPRVLNVAFHGEYPGWSAMKAEAAWLLPKLQGAGFVQTVSRIGLRYIDFFEGDAMPLLQAELLLRGEPIEDRELSFTTTLAAGDLVQRLRINNRSIAKVRGERKAGTALDLDTWLSGSNLDLFGQGLSYLDRAHDLQKKLFFGLLKPAYLETLNPEYE